MKCGTIQLDVALLLLVCANYISFLQYRDIQKQKNERTRENIEFVARSSQAKRRQPIEASLIAWNQSRKSPFHQHYPLYPSIAVNSSWIGNLWIPPRGYRFYSLEEFRIYFARHSILFVGDSTARRTYATLYAILNATAATTGDQEDVSIWDLDNPDVIDINKKETTEVCSKDGLALCRHQPQRRGLDNLAALGHSNPTISNKMPFDLMGGRCPSDIEALAKSSFQNRMKDYSLIIISMGAAELNDMCEIVSSTKKSKKKKPLRDYLSAVRELLLIAQRQGEPSGTHTTIVWRTMGNIGWSEDQQGLISLHKAQYRNIRIVNRIQQEERHTFNLSAFQDSPSTDQRRSGTRVTVVDWGKVMEPRSYPFRDRIAGDIPPHYGLEARVVFLQMLMNHLIQRELAMQQQQQKYQSADS
jgi:hypothetical protein